MATPSSQLQSPSSTDGPVPGGDTPMSASGDPQRALYSTLGPFQLQSISRPSGMETREETTFMWLQRSWGPIIHGPSPLTPMVIQQSWGSRISLGNLPGCNSGVSERTYIQLQPLLSTVYEQSCYHRDLARNTLTCTPGDHIRALYMTPAPLAMVKDQSSRSSDWRETHPAVYRARSVNFNLGYGIWNSPEAHFQPLSATVLGQSCTPKDIQPLSLKI